MEEKVPTVYQQSSDKNDGLYYGHNTTNTNQSTSSTVKIEKPEPSVAVDNHWHKTPLEDNEGQSDFIPHFQRICIGGENNSGISLNDLHSVSKLLVEALKIRERYMNMSHQSFPTITSKFLHKNSASTQEDPSISTSGNDINGTTTVGEDQIDLTEIRQNNSCTRITKHEDRQPIADFPKDPPSSIGDPLKCDFPPSLGFTFRSQDGVIQVYTSTDAEHPMQGLPYPNLETYIRDMEHMCTIMTNGPLKSFCYRRLSCLSSKFQLHVLLNELRELASQKANPHCDFYNIRKVDTHIHAAHSMNQKHLLNFIKTTLNKYPDEIVSADGLTLKEHFKPIKVTSDDMNVDMLDVHADRNTFHRFDVFKNKFCPFGELNLRDVFLTFNNYNKGKYFAQIINEVVVELEESKYQNAELRINITGQSDEWDELAKWFIFNDVYSDNVRWIVQIPQISDFFKTENIFNDFYQILENIFLPLFKVTNDPNSHPDLHRFLQHLVGFDSVCDESTSDDLKHPSYAYYQYYIYANITVLNHLRVKQGLNTFVFRPHCGESGSVQHLVCGFMVAQNISHGLLLRKAPVLQYLYYIAQIGIAMSPISNNSLFLNYHRNPFPDYFARGLVVSLSSDDPLQFHFTKEPLMEEYSTAMQVWKLSACDISELARNSVVMSGFSHKIKQHWIGPNYTKDGVAGNDITRTNIPNIRMAYRYETLLDELTIIFGTNTIPKSTPIPKNT